jgi:Phosphotransferase enzyme family
VDCWADARWLADVEGWLDRRFAELGFERTGAVEQPHVRPWSTVLRVPTTGGDVWFKANIPPLAYEAAVLDVLAARRPDCVPKLLATDLERGWMLMADGGVRLREILERERHLSRWLEVLPRYGQLEIDMAGDRDRFLGLGVPDRRLETLAGQYEDLVGRVDSVTDAESGRLRALVPTIADFCERLASINVPETIQHDDLHDGNVFVEDGRYLIFDWGDSCVSHPFQSLVVTMRALVRRLELPPGGPDVVRLRDAYLEPFGPYGSHAELVEAADLAHYLGTASRSLSWNRFIRVREPEFRFDDEDAVPYGLKQLLDLGPLGSWT